MRATGSRFPPAVVFVASFILAAVAFVFLVAGPDLLAAPKTSSTGKPCSSTGTARKDGKDDQGNTVNCLWDTCTFYDCVTIADQIRCGNKTEYSNARDCRAAKAEGRRPGILRPPAIKSPR